MIAFDAVSSGTSSSSPFNVSHTCSGTQRSLFVATTATASAVTYNGVSMTLTVHYVPNFPPGTNCPPIKIWVLRNPSSGTHNITVTFTDSVTVSASSYTGTGDSLLNVVTTDTANNQVVSATSTLTPLYNDSWVLGFVIHTGVAKTMSAGADTTMRLDNQGGATSFGIGIFDNNAAINPPTATTLTYNIAPTAEFMTMVAYELAVPQENGAQMIIL